MSNDREYDVYCAYKNLIVAKSEYNQSDSFIHYVDGWYSHSSGLLTPCKCVECKNTNQNKGAECDWPGQLEQEFMARLARGSATHRCIQCMAQYKQNGVLR